MPKGIKDEKAWKKALVSFKKQYKKEPKTDKDFMVVMSIYQKMTEEFEAPEEYNEFLEQFLEIQKPAKEKDVDPKELKMGIKIELEHTDDKAEAKKIALQHLAENPKYYSKLKKHVEEEQLNISQRLEKLR